MPFVNYERHSLDNQMSNYSATIAPTGQAPSHAPQSVHVAASTTYGVPSAIASTGQVDAQAPQEIQSLEILCAIIIHL